jgi:drug/metabolite transporter (DMT)-like permease
VSTSARGWAILFALAWVSYALGQGLLIFSLVGVGGPFAAASTLMLPVVSAVMAAAVLAEPLSNNQIVGGLITLVSLFGAKSVSRPASPFRTRGSG